MTGYTGSGHVDLDLPKCEPGVADAAVNLTSCSEDELGNPIAEVSLTLNGVELIIDDITHNQSSILQLEPGIYPYQWQATQGYVGEGAGEIDTTICAPKQTSDVTIEIGACSFNNGVSITQVSLFITGAQLEITSLDGQNFGPYTAFQKIELMTGEYQYEWSAEAGYDGAGKGSLLITACNPGEVESISSLTDTDYDQPAGGTGPMFSSLPAVTTSMIMLVLIAQEIIKLISWRLKWR